jgi:hypothetical protein
MQERVASPLPAPRNRHPPREQAPVCLPIVLSRSAPMTNVEHLAFKIDIRPSKSAQFGRAKEARNSSKLKL